MSTITIKVKIEIEEEIEIEVEDLIHQSIDDYMDHVSEYPQDYMDLQNGIVWEVA